MKGKTDDRNGQPNELKDGEKKTEKDTDRLTGEKRPFLVRVVAGLLKCLFIIYDAITYIPVKLCCNPGKILEKSRRIKASPTVKGDPSSPWRRIHVADNPFKRNEIFPGCDTIDKVWKECVRRYGSSDCMGTREVLSVEDEVQKDGRKFKKMTMGKYHWMTYKDVNQKVKAVAKGLVDTGHKTKENVVIFAETCAEWMISAMACFKCNFPVTTVYATLGEDAVLYALKESKAATIVVSTANAPKIARIVSDCEFLRTVICLASQESLGNDEPPQELHQSHIRALSFSELLQIGEKSKVTIEDTVRADDLAVIMYTSGTTGNPKGVMITHRNIISAVSGQMDAAQIRKDDLAIGYLPLAHIMEMCCEINTMVKGVRIGYSSPQTLLDQSTKLKKGQIGDLRVLKPTIIACVPTVMNRMYKALTDQISRTSPMMQEIFKVCYERKKTKWMKGYTTPILDRLIFSKTHEVLGGRIRLIISGSAPLSSETQLFVTLCFCCRVSQGYGLTETTGAGTLADIDDRSTNTVGPPETCCEIMLREWKEGGYIPSHEKSQGEVLIGGDCVSQGYLNNPEKTKEDFLEFDGKRWFATGDIGEFRKDGSLLIIDRKKDLVKLSHGEYISLGKVESVIATNPHVDNICIHAAFNQDHVVALVVPNFRNLRELAKEIGVEETDKAKLCSNEKVRRELLAEIQQFCKGRLQKVEIPQNIYLCEEAWTPSTDLVTEALKLKRKNIEKKFKKEISSMYES